MFVNSKPERGTGLYMKNSLNAAECKELNSHKFQESVWCTFKSDNNLSVLLGCVYKSPNTDAINVEHLYDLLIRASRLKFDKICIVGDFNYRTVNWNGEWSNESDEKFVECVRDAFLSQMVTNVTRRREGQTPSLLDLVNDTQLVSDIFHHSPLGKSDHDILLFNLYVNENIDKEVDDTKYNLMKGNYYEMRKELDQMNWQGLNELDVEQCWHVI